MLPLLRCAFGVLLFVPFVGRRLFGWIASGVRRDPLLLILAGLTVGCRADRPRVLSCRVAFCTAFCAAVRLLGVFFFAGRVLRRFDRLGWGISFKA